MKRSSIRRRPARDWEDARAFRESVMARSGGRCEMGPVIARSGVSGPECAGRAIQAHHVEPRGMGGHGDNDPANGLAVCGPCHDWAESHRRDAYAIGVLRRHGSPRPTTGVESEA